MDIAARALAEARVEAEQLVGATRAALAADGELLTEASRAAIEDAIALVLRRREGDDSAALKSANEALNRATGEFAALRMDRGVARALTGRRIDVLT